MNVLGVSQPSMLISVVIPAFNEAAYIGETLASLAAATTLLRERPSVSVEVIVVDNNSGDSTASVAQDFGATVVKEMQRNIAAVRNTGARVASGDVLLFVDGDTIVPENLLYRVVEAMADPLCCGGAVDTRYLPKRLWSKIYLQLWRVIGKLAGMAQGATQFCRKDIFLALHGYDETLFMGEDVDFYSRLKQFAKRQNKRVAFLDDIQVVPSTRRFDQWGLWRTLIWTNPMFIMIFRRRKVAWHGWYREAPR